MDKEQLVKQVARKTGFKVEFLHFAFRAFTTIVRDGLVRDKKVNLRGRLGVFSVYWKKPTRIRNPKTGEWRHIPYKWKVRHIQGTWKQQ